MSALKLLPVFLTNLAQILTSYSTMNYAKSANDCAYSILPFKVSFIFGRKKYALTSHAKFY
jgi:hypothetical protein